jgi:predicted ester cyclase
VVTEPNEAPDSTLANKALIRRLEAAWQADDWNTLDELFAPDMVSHAAVPFLPTGPEGWKVAHRQMRAAVPDRQVTIEDIIAEGDRVVVRCRMVGTNRGGLPWAEAQPNGNPIDMEWISIYRIEGNKVVEHWAINDMMRLVQQIGASPELIRARAIRGGWPVLG